MNNDDIQELILQIMEYNFDNSMTHATSDDCLIRKYKGPMHPPARFKRRTRPNSNITQQQSDTHSNQPLAPGHREDSVVTPRSPSGRINENMNSVIHSPSRRGLGEHDIQINSPEDLLQGIEGEPRQLRLNQIRPVLHDSLELQVPVTALPPGDQVEHVGTLSSLAIFPALRAG